MTRKEITLYSHSPREAAKAFLKDVWPNYIPIEGSRNPKPPKDDSIAGLVGTNTTREQSPIVKVRYLSEQPVTFVAAVISDVNTGLKPQQERFILFNSASRDKTQLETEIIYYEMFGGILYGNLDTMRDPTSKKPRLKADYIQEKRNDAIKLQHLIDDLMQTISSGLQNKER